MARGALSFDIQSDVSSFSRAMALVESTAKQKAASFALEFSGAGKRVDAALSDVGLGAAVRIGDALAGAAKRYEADFAKATQSVAANLTKATAAATRPIALGVAQGAAASLAPLAVGLVGIAAAYAAVTGAIDQASAQLDRFISLGQLSERTGVGVGFVQRFKEVAEDAKISAQEIEQALKTAAGAVTPKFEQEDPIRKRLTELFETGYLGSFQSKGLADYTGAKDNETRIRAAVEAMRELRSLGEGLASLDIAEKLFGSDVADRLRSGRLDLEAIADALDRKRDDLITQQQVQQAQEFRDRLDDAYRTIDEALHVSVALEGAGRGILNVWLAIAETTAKAAVSAGSFLDKMLEAAKVPLNIPQSSDVQSPLTNRQRGEGEGSLGADLGAVAGRTARNGRTYDAPIGPQLPAGMLEDPPAPPRRPLSFYTETRESASRGGGSRAPASETLSQIETFINGIERSTEALKAEAAAIGLSESARTSAINVAKLEAVARQQGITLTQEQIDKVRQLSEATASYREKIDDARDAQQAMRQIGGEVLRGIASDARSGASAIEILTNAVNRLMTRLSDRALDGLADALFGKSGGTETGLLGGLLGGGGGGAGLGDIAGFLTGTKSPIPSFASGGILSGPGSGTSDSILARVSNGEAILPARVVARHRPVVQALISDSLPRFADGGIVDLPDALDRGEARRSVAMNAVGAIGGKATPPQATTYAPSYAIDLRGSSLTEAQVQSALTRAIAANNAEMARNLPALMEEARYNGALAR